jgi:hypothetical protein
MARVQQRRSTHLHRYLHQKALVEAGILEVFLQLLRQARGGGGLCGWLRWGLPAGGRGTSRGWAVGGMHAAHQRALLGIDPLQRPLLA